MSRHEDIFSGMLEGRRRKPVGIDIIIVVLVVASVILMAWIGASL